MPWQVQEPPPLGNVRAALPPHALMHTADLVSKTVLVAQRSTPRLEREGLEAPPTGVVHERGVVRHTLQAFLRMCRCSEALVLRSTALIHILLRTCRRGRTAQPTTCLGNRAALPCTR